MQENIYKAPESSLAEPLDADNDSPTLYVVSTPKFVSLFILTFGLYHIYWFYKNFSLLKAYEGSDIWPIPRALFNIFFTHSLFNTVKMYQDDKDIHYSWSPDILATLWVILAIANRIFDRLISKEIGFPTTDIIGFLLLIPLCFTLLKAQKVFNLVMGDPAGASNSHFTPLNIVWIILGVAFWCLTTVGYLMLFGVISEV